MISFREFTIQMKSENSMNNAVENFLMEKFLKEINKVRGIVERKELRATS